MKRAPAVALGIAAAITLAGCGGPSAPPRQVFADASAPLWHASHLDSERQIEAWDLAADAGAWRAAGATLERTDLGLVLGIDGPGELASPASLVAGVDIDASHVETLELQVEAAPPLGRVELRWRSDRGGRRGEGQIELDLSLLMADRLRAPVAFHSEWQGRIRHLEWRFSRIPDGQRLLVRGLRTLAAEPDSQALAQALSTSWRVDLDRDVRPAILALPGLDRRLTVLVPAAGLFRVALGATAPRVETTFILRLWHRDHVSELWRRTLGREELGSWRSVEADLSPWQGREVTLELVTESSPWKPGEGVPAWGGPELLKLEASPPAPDMILISADTLRADHLSLYGYPRPTSPALDRWARGRAVVFKNALAPAPWTLPSHAAMFSGLDPLSLGREVNVGLPVPGRIELLAEQLRARGYATFAETGGGYLHPSYGLARGFDVFRHPPSKVPAAGDLARAVGRALAFAESQPGPVFLFLHSYETHEPYSARRDQVRRLAPEAADELSERTWVTEWVPPRPDEGYAHRRRFVDAATGEAAADHRPVIDIYDSRIAHLDAQLEQLFSWLDDREQAGRSSALLFTSDHGESLGEQGRGGHASLEKQLLHIPLVLALPGGKGAGVEIEARARLYDVAPTLLELAGAPVPAGLDGASLLGLLRSPANRPAWAASPSTNAGVAVDDAVGWRFRLQSSAWAPGGFARLEQLAGSETAQPDEHAQPDEPAQPDEQALLRRVLRRLEETAIGLELLAVNGEAQELVIDLAGSAVQNHRVKSLDAAERPLEWRGQVSGARLRLGAGEQRRLLLQTSRRGDLQLQDGDRRLHLDLSAEPMPLLLERATDGWRRSRGEAPPRSGLRLRWLGDAPDPEVDGAVNVDGELQKQLRALGYTG